MYCTLLHELLTLAFVSVRLPCYDVGLAAVDVWRYDAVWNRDPSGRSRRFPSAVQGCLAEAGSRWRGRSRQEFNRLPFVSALGFRSLVEAG